MDSNNFLLRNRYEFDSHWNHINHGQRHSVKDKLESKHISVQGFLTVFLSMILKNRDYLQQIIGDIIMSTKKKLILGWLAVILGATASVYSLIGIIASIINH